MDTGSASDAGSSNSNNNSSNNGTGGSRVEEAIASLTNVSLSTCYDAHSGGMCRGSDRLPAYRVMQEGRLKLNIVVLRKLHTGSAPGSATSLFEQKNIAHLAETHAEIDVEYEQQLLQDLSEEEM